MATAALRRCCGARGERVNHKRVWAIWKEERLSLPRRRPRKRRNATSAARPQTALHRNHVGTYDFLFDRTEQVQTVKILTVLDEYTRECQAIRVGRRLGSAAVIDTLADVFQQHGAPAYLRSDNGGEFIAARVVLWLERQGMAQERRARAGKMAPNWLAGRGKSPFPARLQSRVGRRRGVLRPFSVGPSAKPDMPAFRASGFPVRAYRS